MMAVMDAHRMPAPRAIFYLYRFHATTLPPGCVLGLVDDERSDFSVFEGERVLDLDGTSGEVSG